MLKVVLIGLLIIAIIVIEIVTYSCCVISGKNSRQEEELERIHRASDLSNLENATLESSLRAFEEGGVGFVIYDGKVVDYETNKCD